MAVEGLPGALLVATQAGTIVAVNRAIEEQFLFSREELIGRSVETLIPEVFSSGRELVARRKDGSLLPVEIGLNPVQTEEGLFVLASVGDATERREGAALYRLAVQEQLEFERLIT